uniref:Enhancer of split malpha protein n=1 Tax=Stomoxys calcitrans TaxID=35570 RepID=A0A1I8PD13_STOCA|nr:unnamed protein product [Stomoxys calcitrans]
MDQLTNQENHALNITGKLRRQAFKRSRSPGAKLHNFEDRATAISTESLELFDNTNNANTEIDCLSLESQENFINERILAQQEFFDMDSFDLSPRNSITFIPINFLHTHHGTFYWTSCQDIPADNDLIGPMNCLTYRQVACKQDRWAQA